MENPLNADKRTRIKKQTKKLMVQNLYFVKRLRESEIATSMQISVKSVKHYLEIIKEDIKKNVSCALAAEERLQEIIWCLSEGYEERIKRLWSIYGADKDSATRVSVIKEIRTNETQHIELMQSLGLLPAMTSIPPEPPEKTQETIVIMLSEEQANVRGKIIEAEVKTDNPASISDQSVVKP